MISRVIQSKKRDSRSDAIYQMEITHEEIFELMQYVIFADKKWMSFFEENNIEPLTIWYHELGTHEQRICTLKKNTGFLGDLQTYKSSERLR